MIGSGEIQNTRQQAAPLNGVVYVCYDITLASYPMNAMPPKPPALSVLYEDNHLLVIDKPVMLPTMGVAANRPSLLAEAKEYVRTKYQKPGNVLSWRGEPARRAGVGCRATGPHVEGRGPADRTISAAGRRKGLLGGRSWTGGSDKRRVGRFRSQR